MTKQEALELIALKTKQIQELFDEVQNIADENQVEFKFALQARVTYSGNKQEVIAGTYEPKGIDTYDNSPIDGYFYWENSSLNC